MSDFMCISVALSAVSNRSMRSKLANEVRCPELTYRENFHSTLDSVLFYNTKQQKIMVIFTAKLLCSRK